MTPRPGKADRIIELLTVMCAFVQEHEPRTLKYQMHREINKTTGEDDVVMWETYEDSAAQKAHEGTDEFKRFYRTVQEEDLVTGPTHLKFLEARDWASLQAASREITITHTYTNQNIPINLHMQRYWGIFVSSSNIAFIRDRTNEQWFTISNKQFQTSGLERVINDAPSILQRLNGATYQMHESRAAAEAAALEGLQSSPDTQECRRIFETSINSEWDSQQMIDDRTDINKPHLPRPRVPPALSSIDALVPGINIFSCSQQASLCTKAQAALDPQKEVVFLGAATACDSSRAPYDFLVLQDDPHTKQIDVPPEQTLVLNESTKDTIPFRAHGIAGVTGSRLRTMEDFISPLGGSDGSNLSPTQENDPAVYIRLKQELLALPPDSQTSSEPLIGATEELAQETGITYSVNDTGHLTLDYQPSPPHPLHDSFDEDEVGEISSGRLKAQLFGGGSLHLQTPAPSRLGIGHPGTVMRPSQMFAETQPSPISRDLQLLLPSSSRPSPNLFNQYQSSKNLTSSPLARRVGKRQSEDVADFNISSSPDPPPSRRDGNEKIGNCQPLSELVDLRTNRRTKSPVSGDLIQQEFPELFETYTTRKESQERRRQQATVLDGADQSSDDGFSDDEANLNRRARRKKEEAARELAVHSISRPDSVRTDFVEVPSTNTGRRRSVAEEYAAQCSGFDARDTQPEATIMDSQSAPTGVRTSAGSDAIGSGNCNEFYDADRRALYQHDSSQEDTAHSGNIADDEPSEQLPALERNEDSEATESDRDGPHSPVREHATGQIASNIAELRTPAMHKQISYIDGDTVVPETSPLEPHLRRYGDIVSQTPPVLSAEEVDDAFNPFTQDVEFNNLIQSPSPRRTRPLRAARPEAVMDDAKMTPRARDDHELRETATSEPVDDASMARQHDNQAAPSLAPKDTPPDDSSEYITAQTGLTVESLTIQIALSNVRTDSISVSSQTPDGKDSREEVTQGSIPETDQQLVIPNNRQSLPRVLEPLPYESANDLEGDRNNGALSTTKKMVETHQPESPPAKRLRLSSRSRKILAEQSQRSLSPRPKKGVAKRSKPSLTRTIDSTPVALVAEPFEILPNRLRSATQLRGSSRALRRLLEDSTAVISPPTPTNATFTSAAQKVTRSSRRSSTNSSGNAQSAEPETNINPTLSARRRTLSNQPAEPALFNGMAFSVTYSTNREGDKQQVLGLICKNGGRVLEKGFDELFEMNTLQTASIARNYEADALPQGSHLILTTAARGVGFACVIADEHSRRVKFMQALALGLPCISGLWIEHCVARNEILDWEQYHLAAGESSFLGGAIRSRNLPSYPANTANFANRFEARPQLLAGKSILLITGKGRVEERRKPYFFLTQALGAHRVKHVPNNQDARKFLLEAESIGEEWNWVYVDENEDEAEKAIFGAGMVQPKKRKRGFEAPGVGGNIVPAPKKVRIVSNEYVIQSLILGKFLED